METGILLESGTNELEILEFKVGNNYYGINVAKIREIISYQTPTPIPNADPRIEGIFIHNWPGRSYASWKAWKSVKWYVHSY